MCCVASPDIDLDHIDPEKIEWSNENKGLREKNCTEPRWRLGLDGCCLDGWRRSRAGHVLQHTAAIVASCSSAEGLRLWLRNDCCLNERQQQSEPLFFFFFYYLLVALKEQQHFCTSSVCFCPLVSYRKFYSDVTEGPNPHVEVSAFVPFQRRADSGQTRRYFLPFFFFVAFARLFFSPKSRLFSCNLNHERVALIRVHSFFLDVKFNLTLAKHFVFFLLWFVSLCLQYLLLPLF